MLFGRRLHHLTRRAPSLLILAFICASFQVRIATAQTAPSSKPATPLPDVKQFLPENAELANNLTVSFTNAAEPDSIVLTYILHGEAPEDDEAGLRIVRLNRVSGWVVTYEESNPMGPGDDELNIQKVKALSGQEGVVAIYYHSGAGTTTDWKVIALVNGKLTVLNSAPIRDRVLKKRQLIFMGYNGVVVKDDLIVETVPGHTRGAAACCPNRPSIEIAVKFNGDSMKLDSVKALPDKPPTK
jgi:hypothetical protein